MAALIKKYVGLFLGLFVFVLLITGLASDWKKSSPVAYQPVIPGYGLQKNGLVIYVDSQLIMTAARASDSITAMKSSLSALSTTTMSINGSVQSLSADRTWSVGTLVGADTNSMSNRINGKFATPSGNTAQYLRGNGSTATFPTTISSFTNDALYITGINSGMVTTALGFTPYNTTNPSGYVSNLSSFSTSNLTEGSNLYYTAARFNTAFTSKSTTDLTEGTNQYFTNTRARGSVSITNTGTSGAATYNSATGVFNIPVYAPTAPTYNNAVTRPINATTYTISSTQPARVYYTIKITCTATIGSAASGLVLFEYSTNGGSTWISGPEVQNSNTVTLAVVLNASTIQTSVISFEVPANALCRMTTTSSGTTTVTYVRGSEILY